MTLMLKEIGEQPEALIRCLDSNASTFEKLTEDIRRSGIDMVMIAARGTSDHAAVYGKYIFEIVTGLPVALAAPSVFTMYGKTLKLKNTLVIGVSQSGKASDVAEVIKAASAQGAITVSVTNAADSPLAVLAKYHLFCDAGPEKSVAATKTFTTELYLLGNLAARIAGNDALLKEYKALPDLIRQTLEMTGDIGEKAERYRFIKECFVLARGMNYPVALESALKIQETSYVRAKAFATSDFYHGPMAMIEKDMPFIVYAPSGNSQRDVLDLINRIKEAEGDTLIVSDSEEIRSLGNCAFRIPPAISDFTSPFCNAVVAQVFACRLSLLKGLNPDTPRMLNKVTVTR